MRGNGSSIATGTLLAAFVAVLVAASPARADKTDVVVMSNGDRLVCEIKELEAGRLRVKTDGMGTVYAEWDKVLRVESARRFEVLLTNGVRLYGSLGPGVAERRLVVATADGDTVVEFDRVARIQLIRSGFWDRFDGSLDLGGSYTQANKLLQLNPSFDATYAERGFQAGVALNSTWTRQEGKDDATRAYGTLSYVRFRGERWMGFGQLTGERNTELGLSLRLLAAGGAGRLVQASAHSRFLAGLGLSVARETPFEGESTSNLEGLLTAQWSVFGYSFPKTSVSVTFSLYPGLTDWGRVRGNLDVQVKREIIRDFTVGLTVYDSFDSRPATEGAAQNDWGATISLGWTF
jgi:hypothetical protein